MKLYVTTKAGLIRSGWGQSVCIGDYDNDGWRDLFISSFGKNDLYHNNGNGTFIEVAEKAGVANNRTRWGSGSAFVDYDRDGRLWPAGLSGRSQYALSQQRSEIHFV